MKRAHRAFTLVEVLTALAIVGILLAIAVPSYQNYLIRSKRTAALRILLDVANRQERFYLDNRIYTADLKQLGYAASPTYIDSDGGEVPATDPQRIYHITVSSAAASGYKLSATPQLAQTKDAACQVLTLDHTGEKLPRDCW